MRPHITEATPYESERNVSKIRDCHRRVTQFFFALTPLQRGPHELAEERVSLGRGAVTNLSVLATTDDSPLVSAAQAGDRVAFGRLYEQYARMVHGILMARVPLSEVDDLVQEVFLVALRRLSTLRDLARFGAWLAAIARQHRYDLDSHTLEVVGVCPRCASETATERPA